VNIKYIDEAIEKYLHERMEKGKEKARERFLASAYLKHGGDEVLIFLMKAGGLAGHYIKFLKGMEKPFKWPEFAWFVVMLLVGTYSCTLMESAESRLLGIVLFAGVLTHVWSLLRMVMCKMREIGLRIMLYREIVQIVEKELHGRS
jgi:hypothetical protein